MTYRCEARTMPKTRGWNERTGRCKRNATITVGRTHLCEQHAKLAIGMPSNVWLSARDAL